MSNLVDIRPYRTSQKYIGRDNYGNCKQQYINKIVAMTDDELMDEAKNKIWLSAYAANNHRSDYHWHVDVCYDECQFRRRPEIYEEAYKKASS